MLYSIVLTLHSILRWLVILTALFAIIRASTGLSFRRGWMGMDNRAGVLFTSVMDVQVLVGLILYFFLSDITKGALQNFSSVAGDPKVLFFTVEHATLMIVAAVIAHVGRVQVRRAPRPVQKHRRAAIWTGLSLLIVLIAIPWPFLIYGRPLI